MCCYVRFLFDVIHTSHMTTKAQLTMHIRGKDRVVRLTSLSERTYFHGSLIAEHIDSEYSDGVFVGRTVEQRRR